MKSSINNAEKTEDMETHSWQLLKVFFVARKGFKIASFSHLSHCMMDNRMLFLSHVLK